MSRDLEGVTVIAVEQAVAAPYASSRLADTGARVIKVERPDGDFARNYDTMVRGQSAYYVWLNGGKDWGRLNQARTHRAGRLHSDFFVRRFRQFSAAEMMSALEAAGLAYGRLNTVLDLIAHPHLRRIDVQTPCGPVAVIAPPAIVDGELRPRVGDVMPLGAHDEALRAEFGSYPGRW